MFCLSVEGVHPMPTREYLKLDRKTRDAIITAAFEGACADLGATTAHLRWLVANEVFKLVDNERDPETLRAAVVASLKCSH